MISIDLARQLKISGLTWTPAKYDFFAIPDRDLDDSLFVVNDISAIVQNVHGQLSVTFHGVVEWALDYILVADLIWLPTESQLRQTLEQYLIGQSEPSLVLISTADGYRCEIQFEGEFLAFEAFGASDAYALALLYILQNQG
jgi:hypothetical protein